MDEGIVPRHDCSVIIRTILRVVVLIFPVSEIAIAFFRRSARAAKADDRGSVRLLWLVISASVAVAVAVSGSRRAALPLSAPIRDLAATGLILGGLVVRWAAILTLGRFFTIDVAIHDGQRVITSGPYRYVRHPSYTGLLLAFFGLGVSFGSWLSIAALMIPITLALLHRIRLEESVLAGALGPPYAAYCATTARLIPWVW